MTTKCILTTEIGQKICSKAPEVEYQTYWHRGGTGYIDGIKPTDKIFDHSSIVKFTDEYQRAALAIKYTTTCGENKQGPFAVAAFERGTQESEKVGSLVLGGHYAHARVTPSGLFDHKWFENLLNTSHEEFSYDQPCSIDLYTQETSGALIPEHPSAVESDWVSYGQLCWDLSYLKQYFDFDV